MGKSNKSRERSTDAREAAAAVATAEAQDLLESMRRDLASIEAFVDAEAAATADKRVSTKRMARLRLVAQDLRSASKLAERSVKS